MNSSNKKADLTFSSNPLLLIKRITSIFFILGILGSYHLWLSNRNFPTVPLFGEATTLPYFFDYFLLISLILLLLVIIFSRHKAFLITLFIVLIIFLTLDQMRWQPWVYIYILFLIPLLNQSNNNSKLISNYYRLLLIGIYIWSGVHKLNPNFNELIVESFSVHLFKISNSSLIALLKSSGSIFAFLEIIAGILLIFPKTRKIAIYIILSIHLFIILYISPIGINYNFIILPWNIFMPLIVCVLFNNSHERIFLFKRSKRSRWLTIFILIVIILPSLNFFKAWDSYLSFSLYSGKINNYYILLKNDESATKNSLNYKPFFTLEDQTEGGKILDIDKWAMNELNAPMVPEDRVFKKIAESFCNENEAPVFISTELPLWKLMYFDFYRNTKPYLRFENSQSKLFFIRLKIPIKPRVVQIFDCQSP